MPHQSASVYHCFFALATSILLRLSILRGDVGGQAIHRRWRRSIAPYGPPRHFTRKDGDPLLPYCSIKHISMIISISDEKPLHVRHIMYKCSKSTSHNRTGKGSFLP